MNEIGNLIRLFRLPNGMAIGCYPYKQDYDAYSFGTNAGVTVKAHRDRAEVIIDVDPMSLESSIDFAEQFMQYGITPHFVEADRAKQGVHVVLPYTLESLVNHNIRFSLPGGE